MGITPVTYLTPLPLSRSIVPDLEPLPMARVENSPRSGDETYSPSHGKSPRGAEDDGLEDDSEEYGTAVEGDSEDEFESLPNEPEVDPGKRLPVNSAPHPISFLA